MDETVRVGVLSTHNSKETKAICNAIADLGHEPVWLRAENLAATARDGATHIHPPVDVVINRLLVPSQARPLTALGFVAGLSADVPVLNTPEAVITATHKFAASANLAANGYAVPASATRIGARRIEELKIPTSDDGSIEAVPHGSGEQRIFKLPIGTHGDETIMINPGEYVPQLQPEEQGLVQELIETPSGDHEDVRVYVVDGEALGAMRRHAPADDWRTNVARGGRVRDATETLPEAAIDVAEGATETLGLDMAGVDLIEGVDGWYVLEVNVTAGFKGFFEATGYSPAPRIAALAIERAGGTVNPEQIADLATTLDDSVPDCKPDLEQPPDPADAVVGYTEEVRVAGTAGAETVVAKADTGATRTSIDLELAGQIGAGPILGTKSVKGGSSSDDRPIVPVDIRVGEFTHQVEANVRDRSHLDNDVLLGRDILDHYSVRVRRDHDDETPKPTYYSAPSTEE